MYFPQWLYRFTFPLAMYKCSYFSTSLPILVLICLFYFSHPNGYEVVSHCSFDLYSLMPNYVEPLLHVSWLFVYLLWRNACSNILFILKLFFVFLLLICKILCIFWIQVPYQIYQLQIFLLFYWLYFHFLDHIICSAKGFNFEEVQFIYIFFY